MTTCFGVDHGDGLAVEGALGDVRGDATEDAVAGVDGEVGVEFSDAHRITRTCEPSGLFSIACSGDTASPTWSIFCSAVPEKSTAATVTSFCRTPEPSTLPGDHGLVFPGVALDAPQVDFSVGSPRLFEPLCDVAPDVAALTAGGRLQVGDGLLSLSWSCS